MIYFSLKFFFFVLFIFNFLKSSEIYLLNFDGVHEERLVKEICNIDQATEIEKINIDDKGSLKFYQCKINNIGMISAIAWFNEHSQSYTSMVVLVKMENQKKILEKSLNSKKDFEIIENLYNESRQLLEANKDCCTIL